MIDVGRFGLHPDGHGNDRGNIHLVGPQDHSPHAGDRCSEPVKTVRPRYVAAPRLDRLPPGGQGAAPVERCWPTSWGADRVAQKWRTRTSSTTSGAQGHEHLASNPRSEPRW